MKRHFLFIFLLSFIIVYECGSNNIAAGDFEQKIESAFRALYISHFGLEFPKYQKNVERCYLHKDEACIKAFETVMEAKQFLLDRIQIEPDRVLDITLNAIFRSGELDSEPVAAHTDSTDRLRDVSTSDGAVIALYFFNREKQDQVIFNRIKNAPVVIVDRLFVTDYEWQFNRPDPNRWIKFVKSLPEGRYPESSKKNIIDALGTSKCEKFGIMLDRPMALMDQSQ